MSLTATVKASINASLTKSADLASATSRIAHALSLAFSDGTGALQANRIFSDTRTLSASATEDLDFSGALTDIYGDAVVFADIRALLITADSGNTNNVNVTRPASNGLALFLAASDGIAVRPGGAFLYVAQDTTAIPVAGGTGDLLTLTNSAGSTPVTYSITVIGSAT
jgi:hypothetical protein